MNFGECKLSPFVQSFSVLLFQTPLTSVHYQSTYGVLQSLQSSTSVLLRVLGFFLGSEEKNRNKNTSSSILICN